MASDAPAIGHFKYDCHKPASVGRKSVTNIASANPCQIFDEVSDLSEPMRSSHRKKVTFVVNLIEVYTELARGTCIWCWYSYAKHHEVRW